MTVLSGGFLPHRCSAQEAPAAERTAVDEARQLAEQYISAYEERERLKAENAAMQAEIDRLQGRGSESFDSHVFADLRGVKAEDQQLLVKMVAQNAQGLVNDLQRAQATAETELATLESDWQNVRSEVNAGRILLFDVQAQRRVAGQLASLFNVDNKWLWLCGVVAIGTLIAVYLQDRRHHLRRMMAVRKTKFTFLVIALCVLMAIPLLPTTLVFLLGNSTYDSLVSMGGPGGTASPRKQMAADIAALQAEVTELQKPHQQLAEQLKAARAVWETKLTETAKDEPGLNENWQATRAQLNRLGVLLALQGKLAEGLQGDLEEVAKVNAERKTHEASIASYAWIKRMTGAGLGAGLLGIVGLGGVLFGRKLRRRAKENSHTCPRCMAINKLETVSAAQGISELHCTNVIRENPFEECDFQFNAIYRDRLKVAFPTLGVASSGKTHWLAMTYRELNQGRYPEGVHFEKVKTEGAAEFDMIIERILNNRMRTSATVANKLPHPLIFAFKDHDKFGSSDVLVNIFDYAGQIIAGRTIEDFHRRRALDGDGFFFFLDPTLPSDAQAEALVNFREDLKIVKKLSAGQQIHTPVALCVTKIDLLVNQPYAQGDLINAFYDDLSQVDQDTKPLSLECIQKRSELIAQLRETIWPGWQIERQVQDLFGPRFMFFPFTPVGLTELGEVDLTRRTISPYGILEPLLWLLHMNGYPVLY